MRYSTKGLLFGLGLVLSFSVSGFSFPSFQSLDKDNNGYITKQEAKTDLDLRDLFDEFDANKDLKLNPVEFLSVGAAYEIDF